MPFPETVGQLTELPAWAQEYYVQDGTGYRCSVQTIPGDVDVNGLKKALDTERTGRREAERVVAEMRGRYEGIDPAAVAEMRTRLEAVRDKHVYDDKGLEGLVNDRTARLQETIANQKLQIEAAAQRVKDVEHSMRQEKLTAILQQEAVAAGVAPSAIPHAIFSMQAVFNDFDEDGGVVGRLPNGTLRYGGDGLKPLTPKEYAQSTLKEVAPHLWATSNGAGISGNPGGGSQRTVVLSFQDARDNQKFMRAQADAEKQGVPLEIR